jgi:hypothetical protein
MTVIPLDPNTAKGRLIAEELTQVIAEVRLAIRERSKPPPAGTPVPSAPPRPKPTPIRPVAPKKGVAA